MASSYRRTSRSQGSPPPAAAAPPKLRHGRKPMYDSDAEADGLNPDVDDEELERGLAGPSAGGRDDGARETDALLGGSSSSGLSSGGGLGVPLLPPPPSAPRKR